MRVRFVILAAMAVLACAIALLHGDSASAAQLVNTLAVDVDATGNTPTSVGPIDRCVELEVGESIDVDVVVDAIPPYNEATFNGGLAGFAFNLIYDAHLLAITSVYPLETTSLLVSDPTSSVLQFGESLPDADGNLLVAIADTSSVYESGAGTLLRLTMTALADGSSTVVLNDSTAGDGDGIPDLYGADSGPYAIGALRTGLIRVGTSCEGASNPSIQGKVTTPGGEPVADLRMTAVPLFGGPIGTAITDATGFYAMDFLRGGPYHVGPSGCAPGVCSVSTVAVVEGTTTEGVDFVIPSYGKIAGKVVDAAGSPVANATVHAVSQLCCPRYYSDALSDEEGNYVIDDLPSSDYQLTAFASGYVETCYGGGEAPFCQNDPTVHVEHLETTAGVDIVLHRPPVVTGRVTDLNGEPLVGVTVADTCCSSTITDADGRYSLALQRAGQYEILATAEGFLPKCYDDKLFCYDASRLQADFDQVVTGIDFTLTPAGQMTGRVVDVFGDPIEGATLRANPTTCCPPIPAAGESGADGLFVLDGLAPGDYTISANAFGYIAECYDNAFYLCSGGATLVHVDIGQNVTGIDFELDKYGRIAGRVTDASGNPIEGAILIPWSEDGTCCPGYAGGFTDEDGHYLLNGMPDGGYHLAAYAEGYKSACYREAQNPEDADLIPVTQNEVTEGIDFTLSSDALAMTVGIGSMTIQPGETATLPLSFTPASCTGAIEVDIRISVDPGVEVLECAVDYPFGNCYVEADVVFVHIYASNYQRLSGELASLTVRARPDTRGEIAFTPTLSRCFDGHQPGVPCTATPGTITIVDPPPSTHPRPHVCRSWFEFWRFGDCKPARLDWFWRSWVHLHHHRGWR